MYTLKFFDLNIFVFILTTNGPRPPPYLYLYNRFVILESQYSTCLRPVDSMSYLPLTTKLIKLTTLVICYTNI